MINFVQQIWCSLTVEQLSNISWNRSYISQLYKPYVCDISLTHCAKLRQDSWNQVLVSWGQTSYNNSNAQWFSYDCMNVFSSYCLNKQYRQTSRQSVLSSTGLTLKLLLRCQEECPLFTVFLFQLERTCILDMNSGKEHGPFAGQIPKFGCSILFLAADEPKM